MEKTGTEETTIGLEKHVLSENQNLSQVTGRQLHKLCPNFLNQGVEIQNSFAMWEKTE